MILHTNINGTISGSNSMQVTLPTCDHSAVTVASMSADVMGDAAGWAMLGLGTLGIVTLGAAVFVVARKR